jgi:hypothetical protein
MADTAFVGSLQIDQDLSLAKREWQLERIGWALMGVLVVAALAGLIGEGPASKAVSGSREAGVVVEYDRFVHYGAPTTLELELAPLASGEVAELRIGTDYLAAVEIHRITPEPVTTAAGAEAHTFTFKAAESGRPMRVQIHLEPRKYGPSEGDLVAGAGKRVAVRQFVYP